MLSALARLLRPARPVPGSRSKAALFDRDAMRLFAHYYWCCRWRLSVYTLAASVQSLFVLPILFLVRRAFDQAIPHGEVDALLNIGIGIILIRALYSVTGLGLRVFILNLIKQAVANLRRDLLDRLYVTFGASSSH